jgi:hypothetical protein
MAFRRPEQNKSGPSLGYRLSSDRQPGIEIANNRMPQRRIERMPIDPGLPFPIPRPDRFMPPNPTPMPMPFPRPGEVRPAPMPMPMPMPMPGPMEPFRPPPGMNPFSPEDLMPRERQGIENLMPYREDAALDPSDYRTIIKILEAGGNPEDYMAANRGGIASLMR